LKQGSAELEESQLERQSLLDWGDMEWYEAEVRQLVQGLKHRAMPEQPAVFYGSSSIRMWTDLTADLKDSRALNLGFGGSTLEACVYFFERLVPPVHPASLVVYAGDNDLGDGRSPDQVLRSFQMLTTLVRRWLPNAPFGFMSIKPSPARSTLSRPIVRANELIQREIEKCPRAYYIDIFDAMLDAQGKPQRLLFLDDGLHLSRAGYKLWADLLEPYRNRIFTPLSPGISINGLPSGVSES
jgi:lysophospholipase L1-like esterase